MKQVGTIQASAHTHDAVEIFTLTGDFYFLDYIAEHSFTVVVWMPIGQNINLESIAMIADAISVKDDLLKTISSAKSDPNAILARVKAEKNQFTQHHVDQELQADSCATRLLSRALPDQQAVANSLNAFLKDLSPPATTPPQTPATSDAEKLGQSVHDVVNSPIKRHPNTQERLQNLRAIYAEIASSAPAKGK